MTTGFLLALGLFASMADADSAARRGDHEAAARLYREVLASDSAAYEPKFQLARTLSFSGRRDEAIALYSELLERSPQNSDVLLGRGRVYSWQGKWAEGERDLLAVTTRSPGYADAWSALGDLYSWSDRPTEALAAYEKFVAARPDDPAGYIARGRAHRASGNPASARADFEAARARGADAKDVDAYVASLEPRRANQEAAVPEGFHWSGSASYGTSDFAPFRSGWSEYTASIRRHFSRGSLAVEHLGAERFQRHDEAWALDGYLDLWSRAYANVRYQHAPNPALYPDRSYRAEVFQGFGTGWEAAGSWDHLEFGNTNTDIYGAGLGKYYGNFYFRARTTFVPGTGFLSLGHRGLARWYFAGNADDYIEASGGWSRGGQLSRNGAAIEKTRGASYGVTFVKYFHPRWGMKYSFSYSDDENSFVERGYGISLYTRF